MNAANTSVCRRRKYGIQYANGDAKKTNPQTDQSTGFVSVGVSVNEKIYEGSRHDHIIRYADSMIRKLHHNTPLDAIKKLVHDVNQSQCIPPLSDKEVDQIWNDAARFIGGQLAQEQQPASRKERGYKDRNKSNCYQGRY